MNKLLIDMFQSLSSIMLFSLSLFSLCLLYFDVTCASWCRFFASLSFNDFLSTRSAAAVVVRFDFPCLHFAVGQ